MIPPHIVDQIQNLDISDVVMTYITLKQRGVNYIACCPFHSEKTPSFTLYASSNRYKCFGCGKSGNAIDFVMEFKKLDFPAACEVIAADHKIIIPREKISDEAEKIWKHQQSIYLINKMAMGFFMENLFKPENTKALDYCLSRWKEDTIKDFNIGFAADGWDTFKSWALLQGLKEEYLIEAGLLAESKKKVFDFFRNRIIFPILSRSGQVVGFTGRDFSGDKDTPKYLNTKETPVFVKGEQLYGLHAAHKSMRDNGYVHLVEGNADVLKLHELGKINTVCSC